MSTNLRNILLFAAMGALLIAVGVIQSANVALAILNLCLISAIMTLGVNIQWGYAGLFNVGIMGFAALGGAAAVIVSKAPVAEAWRAGGGHLLGALLTCVAVFSRIIRRACAPSGLLTARYTCEVSANRAMAW